VRALVSDRRRWRLDLNRATRGSSSSPRLATGTAALALVAILMLVTRRRADSPQDPALEPTDALRFEMTRLMLSTSVEYQRNISQSLHTLTSLLLTSYIALYVAFGKEYGFFGISPWVSGAPVLLFGGSLVTSLGRAAVYRGAQYEFGNLDETVEAYETMLRERRKQLLLPGVLTALGIASFAFVVEKAV